MTHVLEGKTAFITGAASGIGLEIATTFAQEGAKVVLSDLNAEKSEQAVLELKNEGFEALAAPCDVTDEEAFKNSI